MQYFINPSFRNMSYLFGTRHTRELQGVSWEICNIYTRSYNDPLRPHVLQPLIPRVTYSKFT